MRERFKDYWTVDETADTAYLQPQDVQPLEAAHWVYRRLETLHEANAPSGEARQFHISKEEAERALYWDRGEYNPWSDKTLMWYLTRHGESVKRVFTWWSGVILTAGLLFAGLGGVKDSAGTRYAITSPTELRTIAGWQEVLMNVYFSVTTFSTIMDGDSHSLEQERELSLPSNPSLARCSSPFSSSSLDDGPPGNTRRTNNLRNRNAFIPLVVLEHSRARRLSPGANT